MNELSERLRCLGWRAGDHRLACFVRRRPRLAALAAGLAVAALLVAGLGDHDGSPGGASASSAVPATEVWAVGDGADGSAAGRRVGRMIAAADPARLIYLGDVYDRGTRWEYANHYHPAFGALARRTLPTPGNHEWPNRAVGYRPYWERVTGRRMPGTYATRLGGWEIFSLNSETVAPDSPQVRWLRSRAAAGGTCRLAFWHRPRFSAGRHGDQRDLEPFWRELRGRAALVLNGHEHNMQELRPRDGIRELIAGAGGHGHYPLDRADPRLSWSNTRDYGALRLRLRPGRADYAFIAADGRVLRRGAATCQPS